MIGALRISSNKLVPDGTQIWLQGKEVVDVTTQERSAFYAMFGLMRVPSLKADGVMLSPADYEGFTATIKADGRS
ncbi:hypothetical protein N8A98_07080 [Devosia neptuniae]|uniref:Uncharacterized protein n=1 Tax=Devosia neptuniae TaxID=191302 RepID=A0ABY6CFK5_9HYPH|nr:hypothetical protein [Devosia neptuniae]UXN70945.1 hypothetical protein N8A98_07080 [Devosia neptuniae]